MPRDGSASSLRRASLAVVIGVIGSGLLTGCRAALDPAAIQDAQTAARVKTVLVNDPEVGEFAIEVRVVQGVAYLTGRVRSQAHIDRAVKLAGAVPGVSDVRPDLQVGSTPPAAPGAARGPAFEEGLLEPESTPSLLAVGAAVGYSIPRGEALQTRVSVSPLIKLGAPRGLGLALGFDWFQADLESAGSEAALTRVQIKPVMLGLGYTLVADRFSLTPSVVAGYAFNDLSVTDTGAAQGLPVEVDNSFAWRVGLSAGYDTSRRTAINASVGYVLTGLRLTTLNGGRLEHRDASGDTAIVHVGLAYRLF